MYKTALYVVLLLMLCASAQAKPLEIIPEGKSDYVIILSSEASISEFWAKDELNRFIFEMTGVRLPTVNDSANPPVKSIIIGDGRALRSVMPDFDLTDLGEEGFVIKTVDEHLIIAGGKKRGTMYGVYTFLHNLGCRWYTDKASYIPKLDKIVIEDLDIKEKPAFEYREPYFFHAKDKDWAARNRVNGYFTGLDNTTGGKIEYFGFVHTFRELLPASVYRAEHPEWFAGSDDYGQICMTNPEVLRVVTDNVLKWIQNNPQATIFSVSQNDSGNDAETCKCENCMKIYREEGDAWSGVLLRFVNAVAEEVEKQHPDKLIDTLAYRWTEKAPKITKPRKNVRVRICPIQNCESHDYAECKFGLTKDFIKALDEWKAITDNIYIWHYCTNFLNYLYPFPHFDQAATSAKLYANSGVCGIFWQGSYNGYGGATAELSAYLLAQLSWNPNQDHKAIMRDFVYGYYEEAGEFVWEYIDKMQKYVRNDPDYHLTIYMSPYQPYFTKEDVEYAKVLFDKAEAAVAEKPEVLARVKMSRLPVDYSDIMLDLAKSPLEFMGIMLPHPDNTKDKDMVQAKFDAFAAACRTNNVIMRESVSIEDSLIEIQNMIDKIK